MTSGLQWEQDALARLKKVPFFVRGLARKKVEKAAIERGLSTITASLIDEIKQREMGKR